MDKLVEQGKREVAQAEVKYVLNHHFRNEGNISTSPSPALTLTQENKTIELLGHLITQEQNNEQKTQQPTTRWLRVPAEAIKDEIIDTNIKLPGDSFENTGMKTFLKKPEKKETFVLFVAPKNSKTNYTISRAKETLGWGLPSRYLRAVRAQNVCLSAGCHTSGTKEINKDTNKSIGPPQFNKGQLVGVISVTLPAGQTSTTLLFNRILIVVAGIMAGICAIVTFYLITQRFILRPVRRLRRAADRVTIPVDEQDQDEATHIPGHDRDLWQEAMGITETIKTGDEFERMAEAFHQMLARLKLAQDRLKETNQALDSKLVELAEKNIALYESNKIKTEFLANVSHELRTPLNAIIGFADILKEQADNRNDEKAQRYISNVMTSGQLLLSIINDLLDLAKIEAGKIEVQWEKCSIHEIVEVLTNLTRVQAEEKQLNVNVTIDQNIPLIETDPGKLQQIMFNLISNAIKFTPQKGRIDINAQLVNDNQNLQLTVTDNGPGIAVEDRDKIFEKFLQLDGSVTREHSGTGLGLAIVKDLVAMLGGNIEITGEKGKGAVFTVYLPTKKGELPSEISRINSINLT